MLKDMTRFMVHTTAVGFRVYDYDKFTYVKDETGEMFLTSRESRARNFAEELESKRSFCTGCGIEIDAGQTACSMTCSKKGGRARDGVA